MKFVHRIGFRANGAQRVELESLGVDVPTGTALPGGGDPLVAFDVDEGHPNWPTLHTLFGRWKTSDVLRTEFSKDETDAAKWLNLMSEWHHGYPQPAELTFGYREATYDLTHYCDQCGVGLKQKAPFQMKSEPNWGKRTILQLNWVSDEYFVTPQVWESVFEPHGIGSGPVLNTKGIELKTVVQLMTSEEVGIVNNGLYAEKCACSKCGRTKHLPVTRGPFPAIAHEPLAAMVKTHEYFGSGASAYKGVLISQAIACALIASKVRGASLRPVAESKTDGPRM
jgi:hypothetical protein